MKTKWFWMWIGGAIGRVAGTGIVIGVFITIFGSTPGEIFARMFDDPPAWLTSPWVNPSLTIIGLVIITVSLHYNKWSLRQKAIDELAEDLSWAISSLLNKQVLSDSELEEWEREFGEWCSMVSKKLENRAFFTRADQLHFDRLGFVPEARFAHSYNRHHAWLVDQLNIKFDRLRDIINWTQIRRS